MSAVEFLEALVRTPSVSGDELAIAELVEAWFRVRGLDVRRVGDHQENDLSIAGDLAAAAAGPAAGFEQGCRKLAVAVQADLVAGVDEVAGHGRAHDAEADESGFHVVSFG